MKHRKVKASIAAAAAGLILGQLAISSAEARPVGGRGVSAASGRTMQVRSSSASSVNWSGHSASNRSVDRTNASTINRNVNRDVNVDVDHHYNIDHDYDWGDHYHPVARAAAATAVTAAAIGSYYRYLPANCATVYRGTVIYYQCGTAWYQPYYAGTTVQYVVVKAPL